MARPLRRSHVFSAWWLVAFSIVLYCGRVSPAQYRYRTWTAEDGLPENIVRGLTQGRNGYLWIATMDGLARFDGVRFVVFNKSNADGIATNRFVDMFATANGDLWMPTEAGHLTRLHDGKFHTYDVDIRGLTGDSAGHLWLLLRNNTIQEWDAASGQFLRLVSTAGEPKYRPLHWENAGFWGADAEGLHVFFDGHFTTYPIPAGISDDNVGVLARDRGGALWLETGDRRLVRIAPDGTHGPISKPDESLTSSFVDARGHEWAIHIGFHLGREIDVPVAGAITKIAYSSLFEDREKNLWLGTEGNGLFQLAKETIRSLSKEQGLGGRNVYPVMQARDGAVWAGVWAAGLSRIEKAGIRSFTVADGLPNNQPTALAQDRDGRIWVGTHGGLAVFDGTRFHIPTEPILPEATLVQAIYQARDGALWFGTTSGLVSYRDGRSQLFDEASGLASNDVRAIVGDAQGTLWIAGYGGLTRIQQGRLTHWTEQDGLPSSMLRSLYLDEAGVLWIGTYDGGLGRLKDGHFTRYTERDGLFNNGVFQILEDDHRDLWMCGNRGVSRVSKRELNEFASGELGSIASVAYGKADGMLNVECNGGTMPAGTRTSDGRLWFPTQDGLAIIDPVDVRYDLQPPPAVIESVSADHVTLALTQNVKVQPGYENVDIQYTALSFIKSKQIRFRYKLEGHDSKWVDAGMRRTAYYSHLPPGRYVFRVAALNSDGAGNAMGDRITLTILAPFYRTMWFSTALVVLALMLAYALWHRRIAQLQQAQEQQQMFSRRLIAFQENERKRIAGELHDSIGQRLAVINNLAHLVLRGMLQPADALQVEEISCEALLAIDEARAISYNLRPYQLDRLGLCKAIEGMIRTVSSASGIVVCSKLDPIDEVFREELRINFYRIVQESLNNVIKHSGAKEATVLIAVVQGSLRLVVSDDGRGFAQGVRQGDSMGFGMAGMTERARLLGGELNVRSSPGNGTTVTVEIALKGRTHV